MTKYETLRIRRDGGIVHLVLNRADKRNAMSALMLAELTDFAQTIGADPATRAVILSNKENIFYTNNDLN